MKYSVCETYILQTMSKIERRTLPFVAVALAGTSLLAIGMYPADLPAKADPTFIDTIFDNRGVIWAARLLLVSAAVVGGIFIVASTAIRMKNGEWLRRAGPFEVSEDTAGEFEGQVERWREVAAIRQEHVEELTEQLVASDELIQQLRGALSMERSDGDF
jgi:hypothetical protein